MRPRALIIASLLATSFAVAQPAPPVANTGGGVNPTAAPAGKPAPAAATAPGAAATGLPADPWPRKVDLANASVLVYQPQINSWNGNQLDFRSAVAIQPAGTKQETFGVIFATTRTHVDKADRSVVLENLKVYKSDFPMLPDRGAAYAAELQKNVAAEIRTISLDRMEAALAAAGVKPPTVAVNNSPPRVLVSYQPAILVPIDGTPVMQPVPGYPKFQRIVNTHALIVQGPVDKAYYLHVYDGWLTATSLAGPWTEAPMLPFVRKQFDATAQDLGKKGIVDLLDGGPKADPKPSLAKGVPAIYVSTEPAELIEFAGKPDFVPIVGTQLLWASNTHSDVLVDTTTSSYYVLLAGRWFRGPGLSGPWTFVAANALPADFARIPPHSLAGAVLPAVSGTPQAQEAMIANTIPQTATVPRSNGPKFAPTFDGAPQYRPIAGTPLNSVVNASAPIIQVDANTYFAVSGGVWFSATSVTGPWSVAASVPAIVYSIPASSPLHYVTYVRIYEATPQYVYVGYTPGYLGTVITPEGTVVFGTGYVYDPWIGTVWYPAPVTYTVAAVPVYNPYVGFTFGFAMGLAASAWTYPYYGGAWYYPVYWGPYPCCATASANVYGQWGNTVYSGTRTWYAGGGVAGTTSSGTYSNPRASGSYNTFSQYNAWTGNATRGYDRTINTAAGGSGDVARATNYNTYTGQRSTANAASGTTAGGSTYDRAGASTAGPEGNAHIGGGQTYNAKTGETNTWGTATVNNNHYADVNGNVYKNTGDGWQKADGGGSAPETSSWGDRESQARSTGESRYGNYSASEANRFGSGAAGGARSGIGSYGGGERAAGGSWGGRLGASGGGARAAGGGFHGRR